MTTDLTVCALTAARRPLRPALAAALGFSAVVNLLMLTPALYMLQVYDRVLVSRSVPTLLALSLIAACLFIALGLLDHARARILARIGTRLQVGLQDRVFAAALRRGAVAPRAPAATEDDLDAYVRPWATPLAPALADLPWAPVFLLALFAFHPAMGALALAGGAALAACALASQHSTAPAQARAITAAQAAATLAARLREGSGGPGPAARWRSLRLTALEQAARAADAAGGWAAASRALRLALQSAMLGLGAWLVLHNSLSPGVMIAGSILMGRALQPIETAIVHWPLMTRARTAGTRLAALLAAVPPDRPRLPLPRPATGLWVQGLTVIPPGVTTPALRNVSFRLAPGQVLGVIGPSGAGKTTLARALTGGWHPAAGCVRLGGATLDQYDPADLARLIGHLPQRVSLLEATVAENIAGLDETAAPSAIAAAAQKAGVQDLILRLPAGYDTPLGANGAGLSGGQIQRIGLARALYGDPALLVLDEPNASLDAEGQAALNHAIRSARDAGAAVVVLAHRPAALQPCDLLMVLAEGRVQSFGPRDQILRETLRNVGQVAPAPGPGALAGGVA